MFIYLDGNTRKYIRLFTKICKISTSKLLSEPYLFEKILMYRHSSICAVNVGTHKKTAESKTRVNRGYLVVLKGRKIR